MALAVAKISSRPCAASAARRASCSWCSSSRALALRAIALGVVGDERDGAGHLAFAFDERRRRQADLDGAAIPSLIPGLEVEQHLAVEHALDVGGHFVDALLGNHRHWSSQRLLLQEAEGALGGGVPHAHVAVAAEGDDGQRRGLEYGLQRGVALAQRLLGALALGDVLEDADAADDAAELVADGGEVGAHGRDFAGGGRAVVAFVMRVATGERDLDAVDDERVAQGRLIEPDEPPLRRADDAHELIVAGGDDAAAVEVPDAERRVLEDEAIARLGAVGVLARVFAERLRPSLQRQHDGAVADAGDDTVDLDLDAVAAHGRQAHRALGRRMRLLEQAVEQRASVDLGDARRRQRRQRLTDEQLARPSQELLGGEIGPADMADVVERERGDGHRFEELERVAVVEPCHPGFIIPNYKRSR